jgi:hypothetical protein
MGNFYTNVVVRGPSEADVVDTLVALGRTGYVVTHPAGFVFVYDDEADKQREGVVESLALTLATRLRCPALAALNHDDDFLLLWLYDREAAETRFAYRVTFDGDKRSPSAEEFVDEVRRAFGTIRDSAPDAQEHWKMRLIKLLAPTLSSLPVMKHEQILRQSRIPLAPAMVGYRYVYQGDLTDQAPALRVRSVP